MEHFRQIRSVLKLMTYMYTLFIKFEYSKIRMMVLIKHNGSIFIYFNTREKKNMLLCLNPNKNHCKLGAFTEKKISNICVFS